MKPDFIISDAAYPWALILADMLKIPFFSTCSSTFMPMEVRIALWGWLKDVDFVKKSVEWIKSECGYDYNPVNSYTNFSPLTINFTTPELHLLPPIDCIHYVGVGFPPLLENGLFADDAEYILNNEAVRLTKVKKEEGLRIIYISLGTLSLSLSLSRTNDLSLERMISLS